MKHLLITTILIGLFSCEKENKKCWKCTAEIHSWQKSTTASVTTNNGLKYFTEDVCFKTEDEIRAYEKAKYSYEVHAFNSSSSNFLYQEIIYTCKEEK